jgi:hypothetical protein
MSTDARVGVKEATTPTHYIDNGEVTNGSAQTVLRQRIEAPNLESVEGTTTDVAVVSDANGTVSGKLRGLVKILASVWDSVNGRLKVDGSAVTQPVSLAGSSTATAPGTLVIDVTAAQVLAANASRKSVMIENTSVASTLYFGYGSNPTTSNGVKVRPGEYLFEDRYTGAIHAIADVAFSAPYVEVT